MFSATNIGHGHPKLIEAVVETMRRSEPPTFFVFLLLQLTPVL